MCIALPTQPRPSGARTRVWDLPTRIFHWGLVLLVAGAFVTGHVGGNAMVWHGRCGIAILGLLAFRLCWGVVGSTYARFATFVRGPGTIVSYLKGQWRGQGHNPLGALSVLGLISAFGFQAVTGLVANDDIAFTGPLYVLVSKETSDLWTGWHKLNEYLLIALVGLHLGAIGFYARAKGVNLVRPMLTGWAEGRGEDAKGGGVIALMIAVAIGGLAAWAASGALNPPPPAPAPTNTNNW